MITNDRLILREDIVKLNIPITTETPPLKKLFLFNDLLIFSPLEKYAKDNVFDEYPDTDLDSCYIYSLNKISVNKESSGNDQPRIITLFISPDKPLNIEFLSKKLKFAWLNIFESSQTLYVQKQNRKEQQQQKILDEDNPNQGIFNGLVSSIYYAGSQGRSSKLTGVSWIPDSDVFFILSKHLQFLY